MPDALPFVLLAITWAGFTPLLKLAEMINERRDKILDAESKMPLRQRKQLLYSDWLLYLSMGVCYLLIFTVMFAVLPEYLSAPGWGKRVLCYIAAAFPGIFSVAALAGGYSDYRLMAKFLEGYNQRPNQAPADVTMIVKPQEIQAELGAAADSPREQSATSHNVKPA